MPATPSPQVVTYRPPGTSIDVRFPLPAGFCLPDLATEQGRQVLAAHQREADSTDLVAVYLPCSGRGYGLRSLGDTPDQLRHGVILLSSAIDPLPPGQLAAMSAQQIANLVVNRRPIPKRSDIANWDAELRALAKDLAEGALFDFAIAPDDLNGNYKITIGRPADQVVMLGSDSLLGLKRHLFVVVELYVDFDRTELSVADVITERRRWAKVLQDANR